MNTISPLRPAMTAIAAVIALSSTPLLAQATDAAATQAPVISAPAPVVTPPVVEQVAVSEASAAPVATAPVQTIGTPVVHTEDSSAAVQAAPQRIASVKRSITPAIAVTRAAAPAETVTAQPKLTPAAAPIAPAPVAAKVAPAPVAPIAKAATVQAASTQTIDSETIPVAIGLGVIVLGGAFALSRRKRRDDEEEFVLEPTAMVAEPVAIVKAAPASRTARTTALPNGFDVSRFGRHTQAAYRGPTKDNPSYSLKRRLSHASFFDQREREAALAKAPVATTRVAPVTAARAKADNEEQVTIRMTPQRRTKRAGFAFQK